MLAAASIVVSCISPAHAQPTGSYLDTDGTIREVDAEYDRLHRPPAPQHYARSFIEMGIVLGVLTIGYWSMPHAMAEDWDDPQFWRRLDGSAWRTDNNALPLNFLFHPLGGAYAHAGARANHHNVPTAAALGLLSSFLWEFVFEYREFVSVNDLIVTTAAGIPIGEFLHKLGMYLDTSRRPSRAMKATQWTLGHAVRRDRAFDGRPAPEPPARDSLGLSSDIAHDFWFFSSVHFGRTPESGNFGVYRLGFEGSLVSIPGYQKPGRFRKFFTNADVTSATVVLEGSEHGPGGFVATDTILLGMHAQSIVGTTERAQGVAATIGPAMAYRYLDSSAGGVREQLGAVHLLGPALDWHARAPGMRFDFSARAFVDYAGVHSHAYPQWLEAYPDEVGKHITRNRGYFYAWGRSGEVSGKIDLGPFRLHGATFYGKYRSQDGLNRFQERITVDVPLRTNVLHVRAGLQLRPTKLPLSLGISAEARRWESRAGEFRAREHVLTRGFEASLRF